MKRPLGAAAIFGAKLYFIVASMALGFALINQLSPEAYGRYFLVNDLVSLVGAVLIGGVLQSVSRHVAQEPDRVHDIRSAAIRGIGRLGAFSSVALALLSWPLAAALGDASLTPLILIVSPIPFCYSLYAAHIGVINGRRLFGRQAGFDVGFATLKAVLMVAAAWMGLGAFGVLGGFAATTVVILVFATPASRAGAPHTPFPARDIVAFSLVTLVYVAAINGALRADTWVVKRGFDDTSVGLYSVSLQVARIPYQVSVAVALVMFPFLAARGTGEDDSAMGSLIERALRYGFVLAGAATAVLVGCGEEFLFVLDPRKADAGALLQLTGPAMLAYTLTYLICTLLVGRGRPGRALATAAVTLALVAALSRLGVSVSTAGVAASGSAVPAALFGAAAGVLIANVCGLVTAAVVLRRSTGVGPGLRFLMTAVTVAGVVVLGAHWSPAGDVGQLSADARVHVAGWLLVKVASLGALTVVALLALRIVRVSELRGLLGRRAA